MMFELGFHRRFFGIRVWFGCKLKSHKTILTPTAVNCLTDDKTTIIDNILDGPVTSKLFLRNRKRIKIKYSVPARSFGY